MMNAHKRGAADVTPPVDQEGMELIHSKQPILLCSEHSKEMDSYCKKCCQVVCKECVQTSSSHRGHVIDQMENVRKGLVQEIRCLVQEVEMRIIKLTKEMEDSARADQQSVSSCRTSINEYFDNYEEVVEAKIERLREKLLLSKKHKEQLLEKLENMSRVQNKNRAVDHDLIKQSTEGMSSVLASAKELMQTSNDVKVVCESEKVIQRLKTVANFKIDSACMQPTPVFSFSNSADPLQSEVINPRSIVVEGLRRVKVGANSFTITLTEPLVNKARLRINITLPNGKKADPESIKFTSQGENSWSVAFYIPTGSFPITGFFSSGASKVTVRVIVCDIEIEGSPFVVPCEKVLGKDLVHDISL